MFTGLIEEVGRIASIERLEAGSRFVMEAAVVTSDLRDGDSISVNGVCLTALDVTDHSFTAELSPETLQRTTLSRLGPGVAVNLERAVTPQTRLGGHMVQGHVDARGRLTSVRDQGDFHTIAIVYPHKMSRYLVMKGSIAVEGISLTVAGLADHSFDIALVPKTWENTNLSSLSVGDEVNLEFDVIAKYVEKMVQASMDRA